MSTPQERGLCLLPTVRRLVQKDVRKHLLNDDYVLEVSKAFQGVFLTR